MKIQIRSLIATLAIVLTGTTTFAADIVDTAVGAGKFKTLALAATRGTRKMH